MNQLSSKDVQGFTAGALSLMGFRALIWAPHYLLFEKSIGACMAYLFVGLSLPLGVGLLLGHRRVFRLIEIYLWLRVVGNSIYLTVAALHSSPFVAQHYGVRTFTWWNVPDCVAPFLLLGLLYWGRSRGLNRDTFPNPAAVGGGD